MYTRRRFLATSAIAAVGVGLAAFVGKPYEAVALQAVPPIRIPFIADLPLIGEALYNQQALVYFSWALFWGLLWFLHRSRTGLVLRAVGESPASAHAIGYPVVAIRYLAVMFGGACAGLAGAQLSLVYTPQWVENMSAGRGWIALALVVFASWRPWRVLAGGYIFGAVGILQLHAQAFGIGVPSQFLSMLHQMESAPPATPAPPPRLAEAPGGRYSIPSREDCLACHGGTRSPVLASRPITRSSWVCTTTISPLLAGAASTSLVTRERHCSSPSLESSAITSPLSVPSSTWP